MTFARFALAIACRVFAHGEPESQNISAPRPTKHCSPMPEPGIPHAIAGTYAVRCCGATRRPCVALRTYVATQGIGQEICAALDTT